MPSQPSSDYQQTTRCPKCGAEPGRPCVTPTGTTRGLIHQARTNAAQTRGGAR